MKSPRELHEEGRVISYALENDKIKNFNDKHDASGKFGTKGGSGKSKGSDYDPAHDGEQAVKKDRRDAIKAKKDKIRERHGKVKAARQVVDQKQAELKSYDADIKESVSLSSEAALVGNDSIVSEQHEIMYELDKGRSRTLMELQHANIALLNVITGE